MLDVHVALTSWYIFHNTLPQDNSNVNKIIFYSNNTTVTHPTKKCCNFCNEIIDFLRVKFSTCFSVDRLQICSILKKIPDTGKDIFNIDDFMKKIGNACTNCTYVGRISQNILLIFPLNQIFGKTNVNKNIMVPYLHRTVPGTVQVQF